VVIGQTAGQTSTMAIQKTPDLKGSAQKDLDETQTQYPSFSFSSLPSVARTDGNEGNEDGQPGI
jgi:hypothetical protein